MTTVTVTVDRNEVTNHLHPIIDAIIEDGLELDSVWIAFVEYLQHRYGYGSCERLDLAWFDELNYTYFYNTPATSLLQERFISLADTLDPYLADILLRHHPEIMCAFYGEWETTTTYTPVIVIEFTQPEQHLLMTGRPPHGSNRHNARYTGLRDSMLS